MRVYTGVLGALVATCALAGCGGGSPVHTSVAAEFIDLVPALPRSLDPADEQGAAFERVETSLAGTLVRPAGSPPGSATLAAPGALTAFLARSWRELPGGDYLFVLRRGVRSPYGNQLSGADVAFSFERELARSAQARRLARIARIAVGDPITVLGADRVRLNVTGPSAFALAVLGDFRFGVLDSRTVRSHESAADPGAQAWLATHLAFYGAYELLGFEPAAKLLLRADPGFWRRPAFGLVAIEAFASPALALADVAAGEASHTGGLDWGDFAIATHTSGLSALALPSDALSALVPNERVRPFANVLVRRALSLAIDRTAISRAAFAGFAPPARQPTPGKPPYPHDPALARTLLARAGYRRGLELVLGALHDAPAAELAAVVRQLAAVRVRVSVRRVGSPGALAALARAGRLGAVLDTVTTPVASPAFAILAEEGPGSPGELGGYDSPALDALAGSLEAGAPATTVARALAIVAAAVPTIPLVELPTQQVSRSSIAGYEAFPGGSVYYDRLSGARG